MAGTVGDKKFNLFIVILKRLKVFRHIKSHLDLFNPGLSVCFVSLSLWLVDVSILTRIFT